MEITKHERKLLLNSLIQTISEINEHGAEKDRPALGALLDRMTAAHQEPCDTHGQSREPVCEASA
jgi:hypothetical protein